MSQSPNSRPAELQVNLKAISENWQRIPVVRPDVDCAAVVKADAYGLGSKAVVSALVSAGCRSFYVATFEEARAIQPLLVNGETVCILNGLQSHEMEAARDTGVVPVLSSLSQISSWLQANQRESRALPCTVHVDTGMNRLGLELHEWQQVLAEVKAEELGVVMVMSHLACAEDRQHVMNTLQLKRFQQVVKAAQHWSPGIKASLANSSGVLLGPEYHFDQVRPGIALYGGNPESGSDNRFSPAITLRLPVLQLRRVSEESSVGYGAGTIVKAGTLLATAQGGYADGILISQSGRGWGEIAGVRVPMVGRISMDLSIFDVSAVPRTVWQTGEPQFVEVLNRSLTVDHMAQAAGTISYEVLTRLGQRFRRCYVNE